MASHRRCRRGSTRAAAGVHAQPRGHAVQVFDPAMGPGPRADSGSQAAGWTAAGMLSPVAELERAGSEVFALGVRSCQLWPQIVQALCEPVALHCTAACCSAHRSDAGAAQRVVGLLQAKADAPYQPQPGRCDALRALEPLHPRPGAGLAAAVRSGRCAPCRPCRRWAHKAKRQGAPLALEHGRGRGGTAGGLQGAADDR